MPDPRTLVEARNHAESAILDYGHLVTWDEARDRLDAYASEVRKAAIRECQAVVEGVATIQFLGRIPSNDPVEELVDRADVNAALASLLDRGTT